MAYKTGHVASLCAAFAVMLVGCFDASARSSKDAINLIAPRLESQVAAGTTLDLVVDSTACERSHEGRRARHFSWAIIDAQENPVASGSLTPKPRLSLQPGCVTYRSNQTVSAPEHPGTYQIEVSMSADPGIAVEITDQRAIQVTTGGSD